MNRAAYEILTRHRVKGAWWTFRFWESHLQSTPWQAFSLSALAKTGEVSS